MRFQVIEWLLWQAGGFGSTLGHVHHFLTYNPGEAPFAEVLFARETRRLFHKLEARLAGRAIAVERPMPRDAPVTTATLPERSQNLLTSAMVNPFSVRANSEDCQSHPASRFLALQRFRFHTIGQKVQKTLVHHIRAERHFDKDSAVRKLAGVRRDATRRDEYLDRRPTLGDLAGKVEAVSPAGHLDVREQKHDVALVPFELRDRRRNVRRIERAESSVPQHVAGIEKDEDVVIDNERVWSGPGV